MLAMLCWLSLVLLLCAASLPALAASSINTTQPVQGVPYNAAPIRQNFQAAANDIAALQSMNAGSTAPASPSSGTLWLNTTSTTYILNIWISASSVWVPIARIDSAAGIWMPPVGGGSLPSVASATTTDLGSVPQAALNVTGTQTIASFGASAVQGTMKFIVFTGAATLNYNASSMILPGNASISAAAGDTATALYLGSGNWRVTSYNRGRTAPPVPDVPPWLYASDYGVRADGVTSDDVAVAAAVTACAATGQTLYFPAGQILMAGTATAALRNCHLVGAGTYNGIATNRGTTFLLTSTSVKPFTIGSNVSIDGMNFYWPNQTTGTVVYPPLFSDDGSTQSNLVTLTNINIVNAYDGVIQTVGVSWGNWNITNSYMYAVHDMFRLSIIGDTSRIIGVQFDPAVWLAMCAFSAPCQAAINSAIQVNTIFRLNGGASSGGTVFTISGTSAFGWRYGFKIESDGMLAISNITMSGWTASTLVDNSAGGNIAGVKFYGEANTAAQVVYGGTTSNNDPAFNLGPNGTLSLVGFGLSEVQGSVVITAGADVNIRDSNLNAYGHINDGAEYHGILVTGGNPAISVQNTQFSVVNPTIHNHGITTNANVRGLTIQGNEFIGLNDAININIAAGLGSPIVVENNTSVLTQGAKTMLVTGLPEILYSGNYFDKPSVATIGNCGVGPSLTSSNPWSGFFVVGTGVVNSCEVTLPFAPRGAGGGACMFQVNAVGVGILLSAGPSTSTPGPKWSISSIQNMQNAIILYYCAGQ